MIDILIFGCFFIIFCLSVWLEYVRFKTQRQKLKQATNNSLKAAEEYFQTNRADVSNVGKEMVQRIKARELEAKIIDAQKKDDADSTATDHSADQT